jgi:hypothetical protein
MTVEDIWEEDAEVSATNVSNTYFHCFTLLVLLLFLVCNRKKSHNVRNVVCFGRQ